MEFHIRHNTESYTCAAIRNRYFIVVQTNRIATMHNASMYKVQSNKYPYHIGVEHFQPYRDMKAMVKATTVAASGIIK